LTGFDDRIRVFLTFLSNNTDFFLKLDPPKANFISTDQLISLLKGRKERGMSLLYDQYADALYGLVNRILGDPQAAEDVLQTTFVKIWKSIDSFDPSKASLFTWMSVIARNTALDQKRLKTFQSREKTIPVDEIVYKPVVSSPEGTDLDAARLLSILDDNHRIVLEYAYLKGYTQQEISDTLSLPLGTVKTRLRTAITLLREELKNEKKYFLDSPGMRSLLLYIGWI
jgi:RNA polymerase sigma-70 factor (ECF subfamily)